MMFGRMGVAFGRLGALRSSTAPLPAISNQTIAFGAATLASAGGAKARDDYGNERDFVSVDSVVSGTGTGWTVSSGRLIRTTGTPAASDGAVLRCTTSLGQVDVTISALADGYSFRQQSEWGAILDIATATLSGKTLYARPGTGIVSRTSSPYDFRNRQFSSPLVISSHDTSSGNKGVWDRFSIRRCSNITFDGIRITNQSSLNLVDIINEVSTGCSDIWVKNCEMAGIYKDPNADYSGAGSYGTNSVGVNTSGASHSNIKVHDNLIEDVDKGMILSCTGTLEVYGNRIDRLYRDVMQIIWPGSSVAAKIKYNTASQPIGRSDDADNPHVDFCQMTGTKLSQTANWSGIELEGNRFIQGDARGTAQFLLLNDMDGSGYYFDAPRIVGNFTDITSTHGITVDQAKDCVVYGNTIPNAPIKLGSGSGGSTSSGTHLVKRNIATFYLLGGSPTLDSNIDIGVDGTLAQVFDGDSGTFYEADNIADAMSMYSNKANGPADVDNSGDASIGDAGAIGSGYVTWPSAIPGHDGSVDTDYESGGASTAGQPIGLLLILTKAA